MSAIPTELSEISVRCVSP